MREGREVPEMAKVWALLLKQHAVALAELVCCDGAAHVHAYKA